MSYWLGRYQNGQTVPLYLVTKVVGNLPVVPDSPPYYKVFSGTTLVKQAQIPNDDPFIVTGLFRAALFLNNLFSAGQYGVVFYYIVSGAPYMQCQNFEVLPNGGNHGTAISSYFYRRPGAYWIVNGLEDGTLIKGRNPRV